MFYKKNVKHVLGEFSHLPFTDRCWMPVSNCLYLLVSLDSDADFYHCALE